MRLGLSTKITEPGSAALFVTEEVLTRVEMTLKLEADSELSAGENGTFGRKNTDGNYYNISFPQDWTDLNTSTGAYAVDPFADYRLDTAPVEQDGTGTWAFPAIDRHLTINLEIASATKLGANAAFYGQVSAALLFSISNAEDNLVPEDNPWGTRFTKDAAKNLIINITNEGLMQGGGGYGGKGGAWEDCGTGNLNSTKVWEQGGGGGGGAGLHPVSPTAGDVSEPGSGGLAGQGAGVSPLAADGVAGGHTGYNAEGGAGGVGGVQWFATVTAATVDPVASNSATHGGDVMAMSNRGLYVLDATTFASSPVITVINRDDAYVYGGSGGGGGGHNAAGNPDTSVHEGGDGGGYTGVENVGGQPGDDGLGTAGGDGALGGHVFAGGTDASKNTFRWTGTNINGGSFTLTNEHTDGNTYVTVQGTEGLW